MAAFAAVAVCGVEGLIQLAEAHGSICPTLSVLLVSTFEGLPAAQDHPSRAFPGPSTA